MMFFCHVDLFVILANSADSDEMLLLKQNFILDSHCLSNTRSLVVYRMKRFNEQEVLSSQNHILL